MMHHVNLMQQLHNSLDVSFSCFPYHNITNSLKSKPVWQAMVLSKRGLGIIPKPLYYFMGIMPLVGSFEFLEETCVVL